MGRVNLSKKQRVTLVFRVADAASWYCGVVLAALVLLNCLRETSSDMIHVRGRQVLERGCDEIYVVREGETLHSISDKCGDSYIVENNPHIHDPDDVFPGLVIKITPLTPRKL
ncbi:hypothetical protein K2173_013329 [Erythroxylum novogranatense]|uniref:LysM domain-containing protein n=1 Tax=Erythroxylum novogranatense TaxID=1862640 RepID=A0AAV8S9L1_9ROSI|nr:hypothetical protein K2173_013329 [Erythroxylum novogranatense]